MSVNFHAADLPAVFKKGDSQAVVAGWVNSHRNHGGLIFVDLRDHTGLVQLVFQPENKAVFQQAGKLRAEWVIEATGVLSPRPAGLENPKLATGKLELIVGELRILNRSLTPPISVSDVDEVNVSEEKRLRYRYLDLRRDKMQANLRLRADFYKFIRAFMEKEEFIEVPTPILANSSPEGARDFIIPSRIHPGKFYALPQAPQQFKQLLMVAGVPRYYQIALAFRDEDPRSDRLYGEFCQLDLEMAFVEESIVVRKKFEPLVKGMIEEFAQLKLLGDFRELTYKQAMDEYGSDKPDLRFDLKLVDLGEVFRFSQAKVLRDVLNDGGVVKGFCAPATFSRKQTEELTALVKSRGAQGLACLVLEQDGWQGPLSKFIAEEELQKLGELLRVETGQTVFMVAHRRKKIANQSLGQLRSRLGDLLDLKNPEIVSVAWVIDFPFYEEEEETSKLAFAHNPFSKPKGDLSQDDKLAIVADQFDLVMNGYEVCSGGVRNHDPELLLQAFLNLGYDQQAVEARFGAMLNAFKYGAPPHAGCAFGLDRILMVLAQEENIRELVAFPKNGSGVDTMMNSPAEISPQQKKELGL